MTTQIENLTDATTVVYRQLDVLGGLYRRALIARGLAKFILLAVGGSLPVVLVCGMFPLPIAARLTALVVVLSLWAISYLRYLHGPLFRSLPTTEIARWIELECTRNNFALDNVMINTVLLSRNDAPTDNPTAQRWIAASLEQIALLLGRVDLAANIRWRHYLRPWRWCGVLLMVLLAVGWSAPYALRHGLLVLLQPWSFIPRTGHIVIESVRPGNDSVYLGQSVHFSVRVRRADDELPTATLHLRYASGKEVAEPMAIYGDAASEYRYQLPAVAESLEYYVVVGDSYTTKYSITALTQIKFDSLVWQLTPPAYTQLPAQTLTWTDAEATLPPKSITVPLGSQIGITATLDQHVAKMLWIQNDSPLPLQNTEQRSFSGQLNILQDTVGALLMVDTSGRPLKRSPDPATSPGYQFIANPDRAPGVLIAQPGRDVTVPPDSRLELLAHAQDDFGLAGARLEIASGSDGPFRVIHNWPLTSDQAKAPKTAQLRYTLDLPAKSYRVGDTLRYRIVVSDQRNIPQATPPLGAQEGTSTIFTVTVADSQQQKQIATQAWDELRKQLTALLQRQVTTHQQALTMQKVTKIDTLKPLALDVLAQQRGIYKQLDKIVTTNTFDGSMKMVQRSLQILLQDDALKANEVATDLTQVGDIRTLPAVGNRLFTHQRRIIDVLESLLAIATSASKTTVAPDTTTGGDIPNSAKEAWKKLAEQLQEFKKEQKMVMEVTADLAKKPKDQYDNLDAKKLENILAIEDKWEKFLNQAMVDLSKIAEQDQSNAALLEELIQMKVELAMSKDALAKKAQEIATPMEANGLESAEKLTEHIERWLQHAPDRTQWQMEEPVGQNDQNMAELPKQLQDMVSDLMDNEEDVTEAMEDMGSKFADSLNKGAGWDAADGPMSNMSAQGVTGNQLPNNNEIQGRSGEGREGRASGEMVGAEAEGKGGRRTPTRMTNEPFAPGTVQDKSKEPAGGATGGGKRGGFSGEGLEGPAPEGQQQELQRMAGKQAALRNEAERLALKSRAVGFNNFKLIESAVYMQKAEGSLKQNQYQNALRYQQEAVESLNTAKVLAGGYMHVVLDTRPQGPEKQTRDQDSTLSGPMPKGFSDAVKAYFSRLNQPNP